MIDLIVRILDITAIPGAVAAVSIAFMHYVFKAYALSRQRYKGRNPNKCIDCKGKTFRYHSEYVDKKIIHESWRCTKCEADNLYIIN